jgi:ribulose 1,5-bisphosphate synthetase/thiazole synthase
MRVCSLRYPAYDALYYFVICGLPATLLRKSMIFGGGEGGGGITEHKMCVFDFLHTFCLKHFPIEEEPRDML